MDRMDIELMVRLGLAASQSGSVSSQKLYGTKGAGISMAQQKRASIKRRNQRRHKAAGRRK